MMKQRKILVTAAAGKTGVHVVRNLLDSGHAVRALVRSEDERSDALRRAGAHVITGDLLSHDDAIRAAEGTDGAYLCFPVRPGFIQVTAYFADAARRAGLDVVVNMSQISAREDAKSNAARDHWIAERVLDWSGVPTVHVRPTFFSEWLVFPWVRDTIVRNGEIALPFGGGKHAPITAEDQARFIATVLSNPSGHIGKSYELCGPTQMTQAEIAGVMSDVLKRKIVYNPTTLDGYHEHLSHYDLPDFMIQHFIQVAVDYQNGVFEGTDTVIQQITGTAPQTVEQFVTSNRAAFDRARDN